MNLGVTIVLVFLCAVICVLWGEVCRLRGMLKTFVDLSKQLSEEEKKKKEEAQKFFNFLQSFGEKTDSEADKNGGISAQK